MKKLILAISVIAIISVSCSKKQQADESASIIKNGNRVAMLAGSSDAPTIENGIMVFNSSDQLYAVIDQLNLLDEKGLDAWNNSSTDFTSLYRQYQLMDMQADNGVGISADSAIEARQIVNIPDGLFASVVNKDGLLAVGDSIYKYGVDGYQVVSIANLNGLSAYNWNAAPLESYTMKHNYNYGNDEWAAFPACSKFSDTYDEVNNWPKHNDRKVRSVHTTWCSWFGVYASAGAKIKLEKLTKYAGWVNIDHESASNVSSSDFRYFTMFSGNGNNWWDWDYYSKAGTKNTSSQHVNEIVLTIKTSLIAGPLQYKVNNFMSVVSITRMGCTRISNFSH